MCSNCQAPNSAQQPYICTLLHSRPAPGSRMSLPLPRCSLTVATSCGQFMAASGRCGSLLSKGDGHLLVSNFEVLQPRHGHAGLHVILKLHKRNARPIWHHANLLEAWKLLEQHGEHVGIAGLRQTLDKQDLVGRRCCLPGRWSSLLHTSTSELGKQDGYGLG